MARGVELAEEVREHAHVGQLVIGDVVKVEVPVGVVDAARVDEVVVAGDGRVCLHRLGVCRGLADV